MCINYIYRIKFWSVTFVSKYFSFSTFSKDLLAICMLRFCPAFWWQNLIIHFLEVYELMCCPTVLPLFLQYQMQKKSGYYLI
jgi:hypothetical protein